MNYRTLMVVSPYAQSYRAEKGAAARAFEYYMDGETLTCVQRFDLAVVHVHDLLQMSHEQSRVDGHSVQLRVPRIEDVVNSNLKLKFS